MSSFLRKTSSLATLRPFCSAWTWMDEWWLDSDQSRSSTGSTRTRSPNRKNAFSKYFTNHLVFSSPKMTYREDLKEGTEIAEKWRQIPFLEQGSSKLKANSICTVIALRKLEKVTFSRNATMTRKKRSTLDVVSDICI